MSIFSLHPSVPGEYRDFARSFFTVDDDRAREFIERERVEPAKFGEYRTRRLVLEAWDRMNEP
jgi:hypothetical protein